MPHGSRRGDWRSRWTRWRELSSLEWRATVAAIGLIPLLAAALRVFGARRTVNCVVGTRVRARGNHNDAETASAYGHAVMRAARWGIYKGNCLSQSLALIRLLARGGIKGDLRFGARTTDGAFEAHAWVVHKGRVLNDRQDVGGRFGTFNP